MKDTATLPIHTFASACAWEKWLSENHDASAGIWLRFAKKGADESSVTYDEALDVALCYGWIDGQRGKYDDSYHVIRFTPRRARSAWSQLNVCRAERLIADGQMRAAGMAQVEAAKADGRWAAAYEPSSTSCVPPDLQAALDASPEAKAFFETLDRQNRYSVLYRVGNAKRPETRQKRIRTFVDMLARGEKIYE